jgi:hypothetical protein
MMRSITSFATPTGLEPATSAVTGRRANQLRHGALWPRVRTLPGARETIAQHSDLAESGGDSRPRLMTAVGCRSRYGCWCH